MFNLVKISSTFVELSTVNGARLLTIGGRLREERQRLGYNQGDFGALAGVSKTTQLNYEKDDRNPDALYLAAVGVAGVDALYVITGTHKTPDAESLSHEEAHLISRFRVLDDEGRGMIVRLVNDLASAAEKIGKALKAKD